MWTCTCTFFPLYAGSWIFPLHRVSHSHFQLAQLPYTQEFYHQNVLCQIDCRVVCKKKKKKKKKKLLLSGPMAKIEESYAGVVTGQDTFKWAKSADASYLPGSNGFVCGPDSPLLSRRNIGGLATFTFCCPCHLFWLGNEVLHRAIPRIIDTVSFEVTEIYPQSLSPRWGCSVWKDCSWAPNWRCIIALGCNKNLSGSS